MDVSTVEDGATLSSIVGQRAKARADLAPYRWGDLNKFASKRTLGRAERAANGARPPACLLAFVAASVLMLWFRAWQRSWRGWWRCSTRSKTCGDQL